MARIAIIGAGWAGCAAAVAATQRRHHVTLYEAAAEPGGRARSVRLPDGTVLDNGQHILIGAYTDTLALMRTVGVLLEQALQRLPLDLRTPNGHGLRLPAAYASPRLDVLRAVLAARGWSWHDKISLLRAAARWQLQGFACDAALTVAKLCARLTPTVQAGLIEPLCISAFNSAPQDTSAAVFLRVLHDALIAQRGGSEVLIATAPLGKTLPQAAVAWLQQQGAHVHLGQRVRHIARLASGQWQALLSDAAGTATAAQASPAAFDSLILACPAWEAARLTSQAKTTSAAESAALTAWAQQAVALRHAPIATVYVWCPANACQHLPPMQALPYSDAHPAQVVFHHARRCMQAADGQIHALLAFVASACMPGRLALQAAVLQQAQQQLQLEALRPIQTLIEKRATFVCSPALQRPAMPIAPGLLACGDYVQGDYPATLEGAVRSGLAAAGRL